MKDVHAMAPLHGSLLLRQVGITGIRKPLSVQRADRVVVLTTEFSVSVDLPATRKGSDLSRNAELLAEIVDQTITRPVSSLESACSDIARSLLERHAYARDARVAAEAEYFLPRGISDDRQSFEDFRLFADARAERPVDGSVTVLRGIGAEAVGMTACPCAMETCRDRLSTEFPALRTPELADLPMITHNQRNRTRLSFELTRDSAPEADDIVNAIEAAQSSPTYAILKRGDEAQLVLNAHRHPKFVEDVIRDLLASVPGRFPGLTDDVIVHAETVSEESIHKYNVVASHQTTLGELRGRSTV
ncbi:MAG: GTP cyclohydrolase MptA [Thermoplasmata archaeon]